MWVLKPESCGNETAIGFQGFSGEKEREEREKPVSQSAFLLSTTVPHRISGGCVDVVMEMGEPCSVLSAGARTAKALLLMVHESRGSEKGKRDIRSGSQRPGKSEMSSS